VAAPRKKRTRESVDLWRKCQQRGLLTNKHEIDIFPFDHVDLKIATSLLQGNTRPAEVAVDTGLKLSLIKQRLLDPVRCGWISRQLEGAVTEQLGQVYAAVYNRAVRTGDPSAARFLRDTLKPMTPQTQTHLHAHINLEGLSDAQLDKMIEQHKRDLSMQDADYEVKEDDDAE
jgi:hypothetical protein